MEQRDENRHGPIENSFIPSRLVGHQDDWYLYAKAEKIGKALAYLIALSPTRNELLASRLAESVLDTVSLAAECVVRPEARDDLAFRTLELSALVRLAGSAGFIDRGSVAILSEELQKFSDRLSTLRSGLGVAIDERMFGVGDSFFSSIEPNRKTEGPSLSGPRNEGEKKTLASAGDNNKGHTESGKRQMTDRSQMVLDVVTEKRVVSIRDIAAAITGCSEKTIQRELNALIEKGLVKRQGERRWSTYSPATS